MSPLISVIIPVYGVERYLDRCLRSVVEQTYRNMEIILVDDGSPDHCPRMCDEWATKDGRIQVIHKCNGGLTSARKAGFNIAQGEYVLFIDSDDYIDSSMVEELVEKAVDTGCDITLCSYTRETNKSIPVYMSYKKDTLNPEELRDQYILPIIRPINDGIVTNGFMCTKLYRRSKIKGSYFVSERKYYTEDIIFNIQIALDINGIAIVNKPLYHYCENQESLTLKYRQGKFEMWNHRTDYFERFLNEQGWLESARVRIIVLNLVALLVGADNEILKDNIKDFKYQCNRMRKEIKDRGYLKIEYVRYLNIAQKVVFFMFLFRFYGFLFAYRKKRQRR